MSALDWELGLSSCSLGNVDRATFEAYAAAGVDCLEISLSYDAYKALDFHAVGESAKATGVQIWSLHLPFYPFVELDICSPDAALRRRTVEEHKVSLAHAGELGIPVAVIHASGEPNPDAERAERLQYAGESLAELAACGARYGVTVAVEDLPRTCIGNCSDDIRHLLTFDDRLRVCFDTNHLLEERNADFIRAVGDKIITMHVSDYDFRNERHWLPYEGKNNWVELVTLLEQAGYTGPFMYEVSCAPQKSIARTHPLTLSDFRANYEACIHKRPFAPFGTPIEEECQKTAYYLQPHITE